jgi:hypothetical protein
VGDVSEFRLIDGRLRESKLDLRVRFVYKLIDRGVDVDFDICYPAATCGSFFRGSNARLKSS